MMFTSARSTMNRAAELIVKAGFTEIPEVYALNCSLDIKHTNISPHQENVYFLVFHKPELRVVFPAEYFVAKKNKEQTEEDKSKKKQILPVWVSNNIVDTEWHRDQLPLIPDPTKTEKTNQLVWYVPNYLTCTDVVAK